MAYSDEVNRKLDLALVRAIKEVINETGTHPLNPGLLVMLQKKMELCTTMIWVEMGRPPQEEVEGVFIN